MHPGTEGEKKKRIRHGHDGGRSQNQGFRKKKEKRIKTLGKGCGESGRDTKQGNAPQLQSEKTNGEG